MRLLLIFILVAVVSGCGTQRPRADIPVGIGCLKGVPVRPAMVFETLPPPQNDKEAAEQVRVLWKDREAAINYGLEWEAAAAGCEVIADDDN